MSYEAGGRRDGRTHSTPHHQRAPPDSGQHDMQGRQAKAETGFAAKVNVRVLQAELCTCRNRAAATGITPKLPTGNKKEERERREERRRGEKGGEKRGYRQGESREEKRGVKIEERREEAEKGKERGRRGERSQGRVGVGCWGEKEAGWQQAQESARG